MRNRKKFGEILLEAGVITESILAEALNLQKISGLALGQILEDLGAISDRDIIAILARQFNLPSLEFLPCPDSPEELFKLVDCEMAIRKIVFPLGTKERLLQLAISNPLDFSTLDKVAFKTGMRIEPVLATPTAIFRAIKSFYLHDNPNKCPAQKTLLVIEPRDPSLASLYPQLELAGYLPIVAASLAEGIKLALQHEPDLVILGVSHQHQKDRNNLRALQVNEATAHKPILALATCTDPEEEAFLLGIGFFDLLAVPVNSIRLLARIQNTLRFFYGSGLPRVAAPYNSRVNTGLA